MFLPAREFASTVNLFQNLENMVPLPYGPMVSNEESVVILIVVFLQVMSLFFVCTS